MIVLYARPKAQWLPPTLWTRITIEGEDEEVMANLATAHLLSTRNEVSLEDPDADAEADPLAPWGDLDDNES